MRPVGARRLGEAVELGCAVLRRWGIEVTERERPLAGAERIGPGALNIADYEEGRPRMAGDTQ